MGGLRGRRSAGWLAGRRLAGWIAAVARGTGRRHTRAPETLASAQGTRRGARTQEDDDRRADRRGVGQARARRRPRAVRRARRPLQARHHELHRAKHFQPLRRRRPRPGNVPPRLRAPRHVQPEPRPLLDLDLPHRPKRRAHVPRQVTAPSGRPRSSAKSAIWRTPCRTPRGRPIRPAGFCGPRPRTRCAPPSPSCRSEREPCSPSATTTTWSIKQSPRPRGSPSPVQAIKAQAQAGA